MAARFSASVESILLFSSSRVTLLNPLGLTDKSILIEDSDFCEQFFRLPEARLQSEALFFAG